MPQSYAPEFKKKIVRLHMEEGRTYQSITAEYGVSQASISKWCSEFSRECQTKALENLDTPNEMELMKENLRLQKELEEVKKENLFLKKAAAFFAKEID
ncbi:MAG: transposase [Roseburia sp.]|nr:transposase [Roseburia sp.]